MRNVIVGATYAEALYWQREWELNAKPVSASASLSSVEGLRIDVIYVAPGADRVNGSRYDETMRVLHANQVKSNPDGATIYLTDWM